MTAYSKAAKRRAKKAKTVTDMHREWTREAAQIVTQERDEPLATVTKARARMAGVRPTAEVLREIYGEEAGRAILAGARDKREADALWETFTDYDTADAVYMSRVIGKKRFPNVAKLEFMPERFEVRHDEKPDPRTEDEKHRDAVNRWMRWQGYLGRLHSHERSIIHSAARQMVELCQGGRLTTSGGAFVQAMRMLRTVVDAAGKSR